MHFSSYTTKTAEDVFGEFTITKSGLSEEEALKRQNIYGPNELEAKENHWYTIFLRQFQSAFLYLLVGASGLSFFLGETLDGFMILLFVGINASLGFYQEYRSEKTLRLLRQYVIAKAKVLRDNQEKIVKSTELVLGDIIITTPGDIIPADIRFTQVQNLVIDESILTGESVPVNKIATVLATEAKEIYQATNIGFSGTTVVAGKGRGVVVNTGKNTTIGAITKLVVETTHKSSFEKGIKRLSGFILKLISVTLLIVVLINIFIKGSDVNIPTLIIFAIALAISVIPEALPVVTTFSFSRGALHLAKHKVVVKRLSAIEDLGSIEVLCTDKTGTITENKLTVSGVYPKGSRSILHAALASALSSKDTKPTDAFDLALAMALTDEEKQTLGKYKKQSEIPFDPTRRRNSVVVAKDGSNEIIVRGAAETILQLCKLESLMTKSLHAWMEKEGREGKRVIAVAKRSYRGSSFEDMQKEEKNLTFIGLISFIDPLKKTAQKAIEQAENLGVAIKILTGDSKEVAGAVAYQTGLIHNPDSVLMGDEFEKLSIEKQHEAVGSYAVFARVSPQQKHRIIELLKEKHEVGFLGEGINDAPALKAANVAIVVQSGSDIAREAADIILLNKSLHVVVDGIREGREIFGNTAKYIKATLASNFGNFYTVAIASLFIPFLPLLPLQILLINLLTDFPMISVATDNVDEVDLKRPRNYDVREIALFATTMGIISSFFDFLFFALFYKISPQVLQTNWFIGSVLTELVFLFSVRTRLPVIKAVRPSWVLLLLSTLAFIVAIMLPFTPFGHRVFSFITPTMKDILLILLVTISYFMATEIVKSLYYRFVNAKDKNTYPQAKFPRA